jgi:SAM-dependent methyltransferase
MSWDLEHAYNEFPRVEEEFGEALDRSLDPRGPDQLYDIVADLGLPNGAAALDVGCGEGGHSAQLARRFGFAVTGVDPVPRHLELARDNAPGVTFLPGTAEALPVPDASAALVWCRDVLVHVSDLQAAYREFHRVLTPGGWALVYQTFATNLLEPKERAFLATSMGLDGTAAEYANTLAAIAASGLRTVETYEIGSEWGEYAQEHGGKSSRNLLRAARLQRRSDEYIARYGQRNYDIMLGDCLWHVYSMIGKLARRAILLRRSP